MYTYIQTGNKTLMCLKLYRFNIFYLQIGQWLIYIPILENTRQTSMILSNWQMSSNLSWMTPKSVVQVIMSPACNNVFIIYFRLTWNNAVGALSFHIQILGQLSIGWNTGNLKIRRRLCRHRLDLTPISWCVSHACQKDFSSVPRCVNYAHLMAVGSA